MKNEKNTKEILKKLQDAETKIENAMWQALKDSNFKEELNSYKQVKMFLTSLSNLPDHIEKERNRILSYCLMRMDNAFVELGDKDKAVERTKEALEIAKKSENIVQIARCSLAYGTRLLNNDMYVQAEEQFTKVINIAEQYPEDVEIQQVLAWTYIIRGHILLGKSLYKQAVKVLEDAEKICLSINNYVGIAKANQLLVQAFKNLGIKESAEECKLKAEKYLKKAKAEKK